MNIPIVRKTSGIYAFKRDQAGWSWQFLSSSGFTYGITRSHFYKNRMRIIELVIHMSEACV